ADRNRSHWSTSKTPSYTKSVSWQHHRNKISNISLILIIPRYLYCAYK
ncbi:transposase, partial [Escherichia coli]